MGVHRNVTATTFPRQSTTLGRRVRVVFHFDLRSVVLGTVVRADDEDPHVLIVQLVDGRLVLGTECQYSFVEHEE